METSATLSLASIPRASPPVSFSSCNSVFFNNGRTDLLKSKTRSSCLALSKSRGQGGLNCRSMFGLGVPEIAVIAGVAALVFGPRQLPEVGRSFGKTIKSFQQAAKEFELELKKGPEPAIESNSENPAAVAASVSEEEKDVKFSSTTEGL